MLATLYNRILIVLAFAGIFVSGVLSAGEFYSHDVPCGPSMGCLIVARHPSSHMLGVPNAYLGLILYIALAVLAVAREWLGVKRTPELTQIGMLLASVGAAFSLLLTYISLTQIHATCIWCLSSLGIILATTVLNFLLLRGLNTMPDEQTDKRPGLAIAVGCLVLSFFGVGWEAADFSSKAGGITTLTNLTAEKVAALSGPGTNVINPNGTVTLIEFGDLVCPTCKGMYPMIEKLVHASNGKIKYVYHHKPLYQLAEHKFALPGAALAEMCAEKGKFWEFVTDCYSGDPQAPEPDLDAMLVFAQSVGIDPAVAKKRLENSDDPAQKKVVNDLDLASSLGITATPTFIVMAPGSPPQAVVGGKVFDLLNEPKYQNALK